MTTKCMCHLTDQEPVKSTDMNDTEQMLSDCENVIDIPASRGGPGFSKWEKDFIGSLRDSFGEYGRLTPKQQAKLQELWERI